MFVLKLLSIGCFLAAPPDAPGGPAVDPVPGHRIVARKAIEVLPPAITPLFSSHLVEFETYASTPAVQWPTDPRRADTRRWHAIACDRSAERQDRAARLEAWRRFPRQRSSAEGAHHGRSSDSGGLLPWAIGECFDATVEAFRSRDLAAIVEQAGYLTHFAADAVDPFRATANASGTMTGNPCFVGAADPHPPSTSASIRERFSVGLVIHNGQAYEAAIRLTPADGEGVGDPLDQTFSVLGRSLAAVDEIAEADRAILRELHVQTAEDFEAAANRYFEALDGRCGAVCVQRLREGAIFAGGLITAAWRAAGAPMIDPLPPDGRPSSSGQQKGAAGAFVGSKHSDVLHRSSCPWAARILPDNRVHFRSVADARRQGRRPCKVCRPE